MGTRLIYGRHSVLLACKNQKPQNIEKILIQKKEDSSLFSSQLQDKLSVATLDSLNKIVQNHGGFICYAKPIELIAEDQLPLFKNIIALDAVQDIGNIGAILRSAAAFGAQVVIYTEDKMPDIAENSAVTRLSSGGIELIKLCKVVNLHRTLQSMQKQNFWVIGTDANGEDVSQISIQYKSLKKIVVFGNEEVGIKPIIRKTCDVFASVKINPEIDSLNVSAAAAVVMWEMFKNS